MAELKGTNVYAPIVPGTEEDTYATHDSRYGKGGYRETDTIEERDNIPLARLRKGCICYVAEDDKEYKWTGISWVERPSGSGGGSVTPDLDSIEYGKVNLLRNSGFTGDYLSAQFMEDTSLENGTELFSPSFEHWDNINTIAQESSVSTSGKEAVLSDGNLTQALFYKVMAEESYIFSFRGKGTSVTFTCGGYSKTVKLNFEYRRQVCKFTAKSTGTTFSIQGTGTICELQLERGTVVSSWGPAMMDNSSELAYYQRLQYLLSAISDGDNDVIEGLLLNARMQLADRAGISGIHSDADDIAFWANGTYEQAIATAMQFSDNPSYEPTIEEMSNMAKFVVTFGQRSILLNAIVHGYISASGIRLSGRKIKIDENGFLKAE